MNKKVISFYQNNFHELPPFLKVHSLISAKMCKGWKQTAGFANLRSLNANRAFMAILCDASIVNERNVSPELIVDTGIPM